MHVNCVNVVGRRHRSATRTEVHEGSDGGIIMEIVDTDIKGERRIDAACRIELLHVCTCVEMMHTNVVIQVTIFTNRSTKLNL